MGLTAQTVGLFFLVCVGGSIVQTVCGFGFGVFAMIFLPYLLPSTMSAVVVNGLIGVCSCIVLAVRYHRSARPRKILLPLLAYFAVSTVLVRVSIGMNEALIRRMLGALLIALSIYFLIFANRIHIRPTPFSAVAAGTIGGAMSTLFGMGGPPASAYFLEASDTSEEYIANIQLYIMISNSYVNLIRIFNGLCGRFEVTLWLIGLAALLPGSWIGRMLFTRLDATALRRVIYLFMAVSGAILIFN